MRDVVELLEAMTGTISYDNKSFPSKVPQPVTSDNGGDSEWLAQATAAKSEEDIRKFFRQMYDSWSKAVAVAAWRRIDQDLEFLCSNASKLEPVILVSALRLTWIHRLDIPGWLAARGRIAEVLAERHLDPRTLLKGLIEND
ncbi:MAG: hypothetical protein HC888_11015 [Candidatus Competibacteraceae bacterium]|nr:hypothetical protein [Candidatus Competibacteraceae bacterium]